MIEEEPIKRWRKGKSGLLAVYNYFKNKNASQKLLALAAAGAVTAVSAAGFIQMSDLDRKQSLLTQRTAELEGRPYPEDLAPLKARLDAAETDTNVLEEKVETLETSTTTAPQSSTTTAPTASTTSTTVPPTTSTTVPVTTTTTATIGAPSPVDLTPLENRLTSAETKIDTLSIGAEDGSLTVEELKTGIAEVKADLAFVSDGLDVIVSRLDAVDVTLAGYATQIAAVQAAAEAAQASADLALLKTPRYYSIALTENQNAALTAPGGISYSFGNVDFDGSKYLFNYSWLRSGFATSCTGGIEVNDLNTDSLGKPYPIITPGTPIDDYTSYNFVTRAQFATPPAGTWAVSFVINPGGSCYYSDILLTITKVG